jgi:S1-C subfamily serine protease
VPQPGVPLPGAPRRVRWPGLVALVLAVLLAVVAGVQAYQIGALSDRLADTDRRLAEARSADGARLDKVEGRATALERQAGTVFNPETVAAAVLPSVYRVEAGSTAGTAFAIGRPTGDGGANLLTNFHVVQRLWNSGGRTVQLVRRDERFPATIVKVDEDNDVAHLRTGTKVAGLAWAPAVRSGQPVVVVGAPLGLQDTVTTGVVSAFRKAEGGDPPVIQFDAPINPGNSGGPVVNGSKQVVGIATAVIRNAEGIGLAVPIRTACDAVKVC